VILKNIEQVLMNVEVADLLFYSMLSVRHSLFLFS